MTTIRLTQSSDAKALLPLAQGLATSFIVDPQAFAIVFTELLADSSTPGFSFPCMKPPCPSSVAWRSLECSSELC
jgi:hypothetical protein